jgi:hypothetical protein
MEVLIGECWADRGGFHDARRPVELDGREIAAVSECDSDGHRGTEQKLIRLADGRWVVYVAQWSHYQGETSRHRLIEVSAADLDLGGRVERLGQVAGLARPLSLDEALEQASRLSSGRDS